VDVASPERGGESLFHLSKRLVIRRQQGALIQRVDLEPRRHRLTGDRIRAAAFHPVKVDRAAATMLGEVVFQPILHREIRRMRCVGAGHHDRRVDIAEHRLVVRARVARTFFEHRRVEGRGHGLAQHLDDAEIDPARAHHLVADVRLQILEQAGVGDGQHALARRQRELLHETPRDGRVVERQPRLRRQRGREHERDDDERSKASHAVS
jgi:hypothetical protein